MRTTTDDVEIFTRPYHRARAAGRSVWYPGALFTWLARAEDTGGAFALLDAQILAGSEPPPHTHTHEDEAAFVVDGEVTYRAGEMVVDATAGQFVYLPRGFEHQFTLRSAQAHVLVLLTPAGLEKTLDEFSRPALAMTPPPAPPEPPPGDLAAAMLAGFEAAGVRVPGGTATGR